MTRYVMVTSEGLEEIVPVPLSPLVCDVAEGLLTPLRAFLAEVEGVQRGRGSRK